MSKNLTRKGLALGAVVALSSTLIAGSPAFAAGTVTLEPSSGTSYNTFLTEKLVLSSYFTSAAQQGTESLKFRIVDADKKLDPNASGYTSTNEKTQDTVLADDAAEVNTTANDGIFIAAGNASAGPTKSYLALGALSSATSTFSVTVQSWLDFDNDNVIDTTGSNIETASEVKTVKFVKLSEVTSTTTVTAPLEGDETSSVKISYTDINNEQLTKENLGAYFSRANGDVLGATSASYIKLNSAWSATDFFKYTTTDSNEFAFAIGGNVKVQPLYKSGGSAIYTDTIGTSAIATVTARKLATVTAGIVRAGAIVDTDANASDSVVSYHVSRNKEFQLKITAKDSSATPKAVAGVPVSITISATSDGSANAVSLGAGSTDKSITVNGTKYTSAATLPGTGTVAKLATTTDASGVALVTISTANYAVGNHITVTFVTENFTRTATVVAVDPTYTAHVMNASAGLSTTDGVAVPVSVVVVDQFGSAPADEWDARAVWVSNGQTTASTTASSTSLAVVAGKATLSVLDNGTGTGTNVYGIKVNKRVAGGGYSTELVADAALEIVIKAASDLVVGKITSTGVLSSTTKIYANAGPIALNLEDAGNFDSRTVLGAAPTVTTSIALAGVVSTALSTPIEGAALTISAAGLQFKKHGVDIFGKDTLTVYTDASGNWAVDVASNKAGKQTITLTSGGFSQVVTVTFAAADAATGDSLTLTAPASTLAGRTLTVTGLLVDEFGNPVDTTVGTDAAFAVSYDGPGLLVGSAITATDADGKFTLRVLLGSGDSGTATVKATYAGANLAIGTGDDDIVKAATITIGAAAVVAPKAAVIASKNGRVYVTVNSAAGFKSWVKVGFTTQPSFTTTGSKLVSYFVGAGKRVAVRVYVRGGIVASQAITVK